MGMDRNIDIQAFYRIFRDISTSVHSSSDVKEVLDLVHDNPELMKINAGVQHKTLKDIDDRALK